MGNRSFIDVMRSLMKRPGMYIGEHRGQDSLHNAILIITGMSFLDNTGTMNSFQNWMMSEKSSKRTALGWPYMVEKYLEQKQIKAEDKVFAFIDLFTEFLESQNVHTEDPLKQKIKLKISEHDPRVAYLTLPDFPVREVSGCVDRTVELRDVIGDYKGPDVNLDFDTEGVLIGIEILP